jgi:hypothetical protein
MHPATELLLAMPVEQDNSTTYGQHFNNPGRQPSSHWLPPTWS